MDSPNSFVVRIFRTPVMLMQPLMISSPALHIAGQALAGEGAGVQAGAALHHDTVNGDLFAGLDYDDAADCHLIGIHLFQLRRPASMLA